MRLAIAARFHRQASEIFRVISQDKPAAAHAWLKKLYAKLERIARLPASGKVMSGFRRADIRQIFHGAYRIAYRARGGKILVLAVIHGSRRVRANEVGAARDEEE
jgi:plasmid stabilization system protein ParE